jgi:hypothetical protein
LALTVFAARATQRQFGRVMDQNVAGSFWVPSFLARASIKRIANRAKMLLGMPFLMAWVSNSERSCLLRWTVKAQHTGFSDSFLGIYEPLKEFICNM